MIIMSLHFTFSCSVSSGRLSTETYSGYACIRYSTAGAAYNEKKQQLNLTLRKNINYVMGNIKGMHVLGT